MPQLKVAVLALALLVPQQDGAVTAPPFAQWLEELKAEALGRGFTADLVDQTLANITPLERVVANDRNQAEVTLTFERYYRNHVSTQTVRRGRALARQHEALLSRLERTYGVPRQIILSIWGMESRYGRSTGGTPVFQALATLAWEPRRSSFFRGELFDALTMVSSGYIDARSMTGSWAGAMGQTQFMPSSYLAYAVDDDGDGRRDIWRSTSDALASIANYLKGYGWDSSVTWGREVRVSDAVQQRLDVPQRASGCYAMRTMSEFRPLSEWAQLGVRRLDGAPLPRAQVNAALATVGNRSFLLYPNYDVILGYNCAHHYALTVAMLSERLR